MAGLSFDLPALKERLGDRRFRRAEGYAERGLVRIIAFEDRSVAALVTGEGGSVYGVELDESGLGSCTCPDFGETRACKHIGAVALAAQGADPGANRSLQGRLSRLRESLAFEDVEGLLAILLRLAKTAPGVLEALEGPEETAEG